MARLENITAGCKVTGLVNSEAVNIIAVQWHGSSVLEVTYSDDSGKLGNQLVYRDNEADIEILDKNQLWSFDADGDMMRLVSEAYRINLAHIFDPYLAVRTSSIEPLPHQISAVYQEMLPRLPLRYILADDPGAGKTIMTGLLLKELIIRADLKRCLIVPPGSLTEQWQDELYRKFDLRFNILTNDMIEAAVSGNVFEDLDFCIASLDKLSRNKYLQEKLKETEWDLIVADEAHKMSATFFGNEIKYTKRFLLGRLLSGITKNFLLLTATPHNGKNKDFQLFLSLIDPDRFEGAFRSAAENSVNIDASDIMRRLVKEDLLKFDGTPLFPERFAYTVNYDLSESEAALYEEVTSYVQGEFNRADKLTGERKTAVGFALTILQRRLASSPEAIYQSLCRRRKRLESRLADVNRGKYAEENPAYDFSEDYDEDDFTASELEQNEDKIADLASAATTAGELEAEITILRRLEKAANNVRASGEDRKWNELSKLLQDNTHMFDPDGQREKLIIFTEHRDTLRYLTGKITSLLGGSEFIVNIHGGMPRNERREVEERFKQDKNVRILVATDAAGEGINLQRAHLMINYDLPWNPNRLEQRFGRIHRIGQTEVCHMWNLVSKKTREGAVFQRLLQKLEDERAALGGKVFDILGKMTFDNQPLRNLLIEAVRYGSDPQVRSRLCQVVDNSINRDALRALLEERALTEDSMDISKVTAIRKDMERIEAHRLQPHFIEAFFMAAFKNLGGKITPREKGRYEISYVPYAIQSKSVKTRFGNNILSSYECICFDKELCNLPGLVSASLICPGHPLLEATIELIRERNSGLMKRGAIFIDENDFGMDARLMFYIEDSIQDGIILQNGEKHIISKSVHFVELKSDGSAQSCGYAPYLDYRSASPEEQKAVRKYIEGQSWLHTDVEERAYSYAITDIIPQHYMEVKNHKDKMLGKIAKAVKRRLTAEIQYWDFRAGELKNNEAAGKKNDRLNSKMAERRADELHVRMNRRLEEIEAEKKISSVPPVIVGGALVIPRGLLHSLTGEPDEKLFGRGDLKAVENAAMNAVMNVEYKLGYMPHDVSSKKTGYDVESFIPKERRKNTECLRFIEVKGRAKGSLSVTVSKNEILTGLNNPDEYILAIVEVDGRITRTIYLKNPFRNAPDFTATSVNYDIADLIKNSEIIYKE